MTSSSNDNDIPSYSDQEQQLSDHCYDGIQEYDNPTPLWWDLLFVGSILFAPLYALWFHAPNMSRTHAASYDVSLAENMKLQFGEIGELSPDEQTILKYIDDDKWLAVGAATFTTNCKPCHGANGEGISGPNLTDDAYIHVKKIEDIAKVVNEGANKGAMPAWGNRLHPNELVLVSSYVASMRGKNLPSAYQVKVKETTIAPWPTPEKQSAEDTEAKVE